MDAEGNKHPSLSSFFGNGSWGLPGPPSSPVVMPGGIGEEEVAAADVASFLLLIRAPTFHIILK